jgi:hypothetical protein
MRFRQFLTSIMVFADRLVTRRPTPALDSPTLQVHAMRLTNRPLSVDQALYPASDDRPRSAFAVACRYAYPLRRSGSR